MFSVLLGNGEHYVLTAPATLLRVVYGNTDAGATFHLVLGMSTADPTHGVALPATLLWLHGGEIMQGTLQVGVKLPANQIVSLACAGFALLIFE